MQIVSIWENAVHTIHFNLCLSSASTMQAVYSLWELCLSQKIPNTRYFPSMVWVIAPTPICCNCVHLKKYRAYGSHVHTCFDNRTSTIYILQIESISKIPYIRCISINVCLELFLALLYQNHMLQIVSLLYTSLRLPAATWCEHATEFKVYEIIEATFFLK